MDYSLLVGVHDLDRAEQEALEREEEELNGDGTESDDDQVMTSHSPPTHNNLPQPMVGSPPGAAAAFMPSPPASPLGKVSTPPCFNGELDSVFERFAVKCSDGEFLFISCAFVQKITGIDFLSPLL